MGNKNNKLKHVDTAFCKDKTAITINSLNMDDS